MNINIAYRETSLINIKIEYDGDYPNLCSGNLIATVNGKRWEFPPYCLSSGGECGLDDNCSEVVTDGPWEIERWPDGFPDGQKAALTNAVNAEIPLGCCGGCI